MVYALRDIDRNTQRHSDHTVPRYLDLVYYAANDGVPFTGSSNLLKALIAALQQLQTGRRFLAISEHSARLRSELRARGFHVLGEDQHLSPHVITVEVPPWIRSRNVADRLADRGILVSYESSYLLQRNWIQLCLFGELSPQELAPVPDLLLALTKDVSQSAA